MTITKVNEQTIIKKTFRKNDFTHLITYYFLTKNQQKCHKFPNYINLNGTTGTTSIIKHL